MATKKTAKKVGIWLTVAISILSLFGIPIRPEVVSVIEIYQDAVEQIEDVDSSKIVEDVESETEIK